MFKKELYLGTSMEEFNKIRQTLDDNQIKHTYKVVDQTSSESTVISSKVTGRSMGTYGMDMSQMKQYYLYVADEEYEKAQYLCSKKEKGAE